MFRRAGLFTFVLASVAALTPRSGHAGIVDRVVAVVDDDAIFLSDLEHRLSPFEHELRAQFPNPQDYAQRRRQLYHDTLERMVNDALIRRAAARAHLTVTESDVDRMIEFQARQRGTTPDQLLQALESEGITRTEFRGWMETEVLRLRVVNVRVRIRANVSESDITSEYRSRMRQLATQAPFRLAHVFVQLPENPTSTQIVAVQRRAEQVSQQGRAGTDFTELVRQFSDDESSRNQNGELPRLDPSSDDESEIPPRFVTDAVRDLQPGQVSAAVRGEQGFHVFKLLSREPVNAPPLTDPHVHQQLHDYLLEREMTRQQNLYLQELRRRSAVEIRLQRAL